MMESGKADLGMARVSRNGQMELLMKAHGAIIMLMDSASSLMPMETCMMAAEPMTKLMASESILIQVEVPMKASGKTTFIMEKVF